MTLLSRIRLVAAAAALVWSSTHTTATEPGTTATEPGTTATEPGTTATEPGQPVRILTFNVQTLTAPNVRASSINKYRFSYGRRQHHERVADLLEVLRPDIANLVEVTCQESVDLLVELLHAKGLTDYHGYHVEGHDPFSGMDVALLSRIPPDKIENLSIRTFYSPAGDPTYRQAFSFLGNDGKPYPRTTSLARNSVYFFTLGEFKLGFLGLHLKSNPSNHYANARRTAEAEVACRILQGEIVPRGYTPVVLGDLNDYDPDLADRDASRDTQTDVLTRLQDYDSATPGPELFNAAQFIPRVKDRYTSHWDWNENGARDEQDVLTMIDHILLPQALRPYVQRVFIAHCVALETSDHFPVVVDLLLPASTAPPQTAATH